MTKKPTKIILNKNHNEPFSGKVTESNYFYLKYGNQDSSIVNQFLNIYEIYFKDKDYDKTIENCCYYKILIDLYTTTEKPYSSLTEEDYVKLYKRSYYYMCKVINISYITNFVTITINDRTFFERLITKCYDPITRGRIDLRSFKEIFVTYTKDATLKMLYKHLINKNKELVYYNNALLTDMKTRSETLKSLVKCPVINIDTNIITH